MNSAVLPKSEVRICPICGSPAVDYAALAGGEGRCVRCDWAGRVEELFVLHLDAQELRMLNELKRLYSGELGLCLLKFLLRWGLVEGDLNRPAASINAKHLSRYFVASARATMEAFGQVRREIEIERTPKEIPSHAE